MSDVITIQSYQSVSTSMYISGQTDNKYYVNCSGMDGNQCVVRGRTDEDDHVDMGGGFSQGRPPGTPFLTPMAFNEGKALDSSPPHLIHPVHS
jgi:hypothetical protein